MNRARHTFDSTKMGFLRKKEPDGFTTSKKFFVLTKTEIRYYDKKPITLSDISTIKGVIPYRNLKVNIEPFSPIPIIVTSTTNKNFSIYLKTLTGKELELVAENRQERDEWFAAIEWFLEKGGGESGMVRNSAYNSLPFVKPRPHQSLPVIHRAQSFTPRTRKESDIPSLVQGLTQERDLTNLYITSDGEKISPDPYYLKELAKKVQDLPANEGMKWIEQELKKERIRTLTIAEGDRVAEELLRDRSRSRSLPYSFKKQKNVRPINNLSENNSNNDHYKLTPTPSFSINGEPLKISEPSGFRKATDLTTILSTPSSPSVLRSTSSPHIKNLYNSPSNSKPPKYPPPPTPLSKSNSFNSTSSTVSSKSSGPPKYPLPPIPQRKPKPIPKLEERTNNNVNNNDK